MKILINDKETDTFVSTLAALAEELNLPAKGVAVAVGGKMVPRTEWADAALHEGDKVIIINAACGG